MNLHELAFPPDLYYLVEHDVWARVDGGGVATVGITALGVKLAGKISMCRAKAVGTLVEQGRAIAVVELAKAIVSVASPVSGTVLALNTRLDDAPQLVHSDPYGEGWIARLRLAHWERDRAQLYHGASVLEAMALHAQLFGVPP